MPIACGRKSAVVFRTFTELMLHLLFDSGVMPVSSWFVSSISAFPWIFEFHWKSSVFKMPSETNFAISELFSTHAIFFFNMKCPTAMRNWGMQHRNLRLCPEWSPNFNVRFLGSLSTEFYRGASKLLHPQKHNIKTPLGVPSVWLKKRSWWNNSRPCEVLTVTFRNII